MIERADNFIASLGVEAYRVGGSVRDDLLGRRAKDADYMVRGVSLEDLGTIMRDKYGIDKIGVRALKLRDGRQAGWRVVGRGFGLIEIVLPRTEVSTGPGHRDFEIVVDPSITLEQDAIRRDFTFNALYKIVSHPDNLGFYTTMPDGTPVEGIADPTGRGLHDLQRGLIQTTHPDSFRDDPLRTLRALRFVARGFTLAIDTQEQMKRHADAVNGLTSNGYASGTVLEELGKILMGENVREALRIARDTGVLATLLPELAPMLGFDQGSRYHDMTTDEHTFKALDVAATVDAPLRVRMALLFHDAGKPESAWVGKDGRKHYYSPSDDVWAWVCQADGEVHQGTPQSEYPPKPQDHAVVGARIWRQVAERLNAGRNLRDDVDRLIKNHMVGLDKVKASKVRQARVKFGDDLYRDLLLHRACDISGKGRPDSNQLAKIGKMERIRQEARDAGVPASIKELKIGGKDAIAAGLQGREIGEALARVLHEVVSEPTELKLSREWQLGRMSV